MQQAFRLDELLAARSSAGRAYLEFLRVPALSLGVYHLRAGDADGQQPHDEDEVYYVVSGRARFTAAGRRRDVGPGDVLYVGKHVEHRFVDVTEDLTLLAFFAPAEGTAAQPEATTG
jgi:mannose-6-phosphate isomerase-like protein (cupin superfamily)